VFFVLFFGQAPSSAFKLTQLNVTKNNVRPLSWMIALQKDAKKELDPTSLQPTPYYNMAILEDLAIVPHFKILSKVLKACPQARDAIILFKVRLFNRFLKL